MLVGDRGMKTKYIKKAIIFCLSVLVLVGCSNNLKEENLKLTIENKQLKQQLDNANEKIKVQNELYDLRNILDSLTYDILSKLTTGDVSYLKDKSTNNISISGNKIVSKHKQVNIDVEFDIPKTMPNLRQRAFILSDDKKELHFIYEIIALTQSDIYRTLNVYYVKDNGQWKLDYICKDE